MTDGKQLQVVLPPTVRLLPIKKIPDSTVAALTDAVAYLWQLYNPEIRGIRYASRTQCPLSQSASAPIATRRRSSASIAQSVNLAWDSIRADHFEKSYAVQWLTVVVSQTDHLLDEANDWESVVQRAAHLLALCSGPASAGTRSRVFAFSPKAQGSVGSTPMVRVQITDLPLDNQDYSSVGAQTWGGACLLADMIIKEPQTFGLPTSPALSASPRVLELGAGTGLVGLAVAKFLTSVNTPADLILTDFHPSVTDNLRQNVIANSFPNPGPVSVSVEPLDWSLFPAAYAHGAHSTPFDRSFDVIYGADIVYELQHAQWIKGCVELLLRKPIPDARGEPRADRAKPPSFHLVIPLRSTHTAESHTVEDVFPFAPSVRVELDLPGAASAVLHTLAIVAKEIIVCGDIWSDDPREVEYVHYTIAWV